MTPYIKLPFHSHFSALLAKYIVILLPLIVNVNGFDGVGSSEVDNKMSILTTNYIIIAIDLC